MAITLRPGIDLVEHRFKDPEGDVSIWFSALTTAERNEVVALFGKVAELQKAGAKDLDLVGAMTEATVCALRFAIKKVKGVQYLDGSEWEPDFDESGHLTDESIEVLLNLQQKPQLVAAAASWLNGLNKDIAEGIEVVIPKAPKASKK